MNKLSVITEHFEGFPIHVRPDDGYWNLTLMCQSCGKKFSDYQRLNSTREFLAELAYDLNQEFVENPASGAILYGTGEAGFPSLGIQELIEKVPRLKLLVEVQKGGIPELQGTWGHELVALDLAAWAKPRFKVWVFKTIRKLLTQGQVKLKDEIVALHQALGVKDEEIALLEYRRDRLLYELDEIRDVVSWRQVSDLAQLPCEIEEVDLDI